MCFVLMLFSTSVLGTLDLCFYVHVVHIASSIPVIISCPFASSSISTSHNMRAFCKKADVLAATPRKNPKCRLCPNIYKYCLNMRHMSGEWMAANHESSDHSNKSFSQIQPCRSTLHTSANLRRRSMCAPCCPTEKEPTQRIKNNRNSIRPNLTRDMP